MVAVIAHVRRGMLSGRDILLSVSQLLYDSCGT